MHLPDGFLTPTLTAGTLIAGGTAWGWALYRVRRHPPESVPATALGGALLFALQGIAFPFPPGITLHLSGVPLLTLYLGPSRTLFAAGLALGMESLILGHGGVLAWGANVLNIALMGTLIPWSLCALWPSRAGAGLGAFLSVAGGSLLMSLELWGSGLLRPPAIPGLVLTHLPLALAEGVVTAAVYGLRPPRLRNSINLS